MCVLRVVLEGFRERFRGDFGSIFEGNFGDESYNFRGTLHIAKHRFDMVFTVFEAHRRFQKSSHKLQNLRILRHISQIRVRRRFWSHFGWILGPFSEPWGHQNRKKCDPKMTSKKRYEKNYASVCKVIRPMREMGVGCPNKDQRSETLEGRSARIEGLRA